MCNGGAHQRRGWERAATGCREGTRGLVWRQTMRAGFVGPTQGTICSAICGGGLLSSRSWQQACSLTDVHERRVLPTQPGVSPSTSVSRTSSRGPGLKSPCHTLTKESQRLRRACLLLLRSCTTQIRPTTWMTTIQMKTWIYSVSHADRLAPSAMIRTVSITLRWYER